VAGEIYLGGPGIARGYLHHPALTAERFVPDCFSTKPGQQLYKTGDLAHYRTDGMLEYIGRVDDQVKIRGYRIEVAEIETVLTQHSAISEAVLIAREDTTGNKQLIAYIVNTPSCVLSEQEVRRFVQDHLPAYMVPSRVVCLEALPLTANGKVDRQRLPQPEQTLVERAEAYQAPRNSLERQLVQIWEEVFGMQGIGIQDDFFALGGHSLLAVRLMSQIHQTFGHTFSLSMLFANGTIERFATALRQQQTAQQNSCLIALQPDGTQPPFFCIHPVGGNVLCYAEPAHQLGPNQPFYALQAAGLQMDEEPLTSIQEMAHNYIEALLTIQPQGPYLLGGWSLGGTIAFEMAQQLVQREQEVALLALLDSTAPDGAQSAAENNDVSLIEQFMLDLAGLTEADFVELRADLQQLDADQQLAVLLERMQHLNLIAPEIDLAQVRRYLRVYQANVQAENQYQLAQFSGRIVLFKAGEQFEDASSDETMGWQKLVISQVETYTFPGNHYTLLRKPAVQLLAERLSRCINIVVQREKQQVLL
jgi:thioesterase domain-containing protein